MGSTSNAEGKFEAIMGSTSNADGKFEAMLGSKYQSFIITVTDTHRGEVDYELWSFKCNLCDSTNLTVSDARLLYIKNIASAVNWRCGRTDTHIN
jgi:Zn finger protein HypA/HybF involved in hydrogenase expression